MSVCLSVAVCVSVCVFVCLCVSVSVYLFLCNYATVCPHVPASWHQAEVVACKITLFLFGMAKECDDMHMLLCR